MAGKGHHGETCAESIRESLKYLGNRATASDLFNEIKKRGTWSDDNIWQELLSYAVNLPGSYGHWPQVSSDKRFLFIREDGNYELYDPKWHGLYENGKRVV